MDVSVIMACLNEAETVGICVEKALESLRQIGLTGEVLVVDNGSTDGSDAIAASKGARVVREPERGYGVAYQRGFREAKGKLLVMADADGTYDFSDLEAMLLPLRDGSDFVIGSRFQGRMLPGSMSWVRRFAGNLPTRLLVNRLSGGGFSDAMSGFRSFRRGTFPDFPFRSKGMELPVEMILRARLQGIRITEVPITYHPRGGSRSKFRPLRDSLTIIRFLMLHLMTSNGHPKRET